MRISDTHPAAQLSFGGDPDLKARLLANLEAHRKADRIRQGNYFGHSEGIGARGCAVGCTVADFIAAERGVTLDVFAETMRREWARVTRLPEWLGRLDDHIFEHLPVADAREWPLRLMSAVPVGVDLHPALEAWLLDIVFNPECGALNGAADGLEAAGLHAEAARLREVPVGDWGTAASTARAAHAAAITAARLQGINFMLGDHPGHPAYVAASQSASAELSACRGAEAIYSTGDAEDATWSMDYASDAARHANDGWMADQLIAHLQAAAQPVPCDDRG